MGTHETYIYQRMRHIKHTQDVWGLLNAWSDFFTYLGEAMRLFPIKENAKW